MLFVPCGVTSDRYMFTVIQQKLSCNTCPISSISVCSVVSKLSEFTGHVLEIQCPNPRCGGTFSANGDNSDLALSVCWCRNTSCYELVINQSINQSCIFRVVQVTKSLQDPLEVGNNLPGISDNVRE